MTRQEKIRGGIQNKLKDTCKKTIGIGCPYNYDCELHPDCMYEESLNYVRYLYSQGVVIRGESLGASHPHLSAYYTIESLIEEVKDGRG